VDNKCKDHESNQKDHPHSSYKQEKEEREREGGRKGMQDRSKIEGSENHTHHFGRKESRRYADFYARNEIRN
jgi:DNA relaxase NicK